MSLAAAAGAREGGGGERRRRPRPAHHSLHLISGAARGGRRGRGGAEEGGREAAAAATAATMSYQGKKNIPRITVSGAPGAVAGVARSLARCPPRRGRGASDPAGFPGPVPREGRGPGVPGVERGGQPSRRAGRHPDGASLPFGESKTKRKAKEWRRELWIDYISILFSHQPAVSK